MSDDRGESAAPAAIDEPARQDAEREEFPERLAQAEDRHRRALADLDNLRKRTAREIERRVEESRESLLLEWLEALDSVERAILMTPEGPVQDGLRSVLAQMEAILVRNGVERSGRPGDPFDPERHEAVAVRESEDVSDRTILVSTRPESEA